MQPEESPTFVETWLEMEKLLDTGGYMRHITDKIPSSSTVLPLNFTSRKSEIYWGVKFLNQEFGDAARESQRGSGDQPG